jgi:glutamate formiminotransferase / 5-formyltetrahydrofolate cyclo-ligase
VLECVINVSEGRRQDVLDRIATAAGSGLLDLHSDPHHHRSVLTLAGPAVEASARAVAAAAVAEIDLTAHAGAHPRLGAVDVVPFVALDEAPGLAGALDARSRFAAWAARELALPCFFYGPERTLPELRRQAFRQIAPDVGPATPHRTAGATAVGARPPLVAYNLWLADADAGLARTIAAELRGPAVRALGLDVGGRAQVSCNLLDPWAVGPAAVFDAVARRADVDRAELVGLVPGSVLAAVSARRQRELGLDPSLTIEARLESAGLRPPERA